MLLLGSSECQLLFFWFPKILNYVDNFNHELTNSTEVNSDTNINTISCMTLVKNIVFITLLSQTPV